MDAVSRGSLEWPFINEIRWLSVDCGEGDAQESHRIMLHAGIGIVFDSHGQSPPPLVAMEAKMTGADYCACHLIALWWEKVVPLDCARFRMDEMNPLLRVAEITFGKREIRVVKCYVRGQAADMAFFKHIAKTVSPEASLFWV